MRSLVRADVDWRSVICPQQGYAYRRLCPRIAAKFISRTLQQNGPLQNAFQSALDFIKNEQIREPSLGTKDYTSHLIDSAARCGPIRVNLFKAFSPAEPPSFNLSQEMQQEQARHAALVAVVSAGDIHFVRHLISTDEDCRLHMERIIDAISPFFGSPIYAAITGGHAEIFKILQAYGSSETTHDHSVLYSYQVWSFDTYGSLQQKKRWQAWTALKGAAQSGHFSILRTLLSLEPNSQLDLDHYVNGALIEVIRSGHGGSLDDFLELARSDKFQRTEVEGISFNKIRPSLGNSLLEMQSSTGRCLNSKDVLSCLRCTCYLVCITSDLSIAVSSVSS